MQFTSPGLPQTGSVIRGTKPITSMSFHGDGQHLFVASEEDHRLRMIDCVSTGDLKLPPIRCEREGVRLVQATHHNLCVLTTGKGSPGQAPGQRHAISYLSLHDNKILRRFRGHSDEPTKISMNPKDDTFLTSSRDRTVRLWTLGSAGCQAQMDLPPETTGDPVAFFDTTGLVFGVAADMAGNAGHYVHLYDARNFTGGAFAEFKVTLDQIEPHVPENLKQYTNSPWTTAQFNAIGDKILVANQQGMAVVLDGYEGGVQKSFCPNGGTGAACLSSDDKSVIMGQKDGSVTAFAIESGSLIKTLSGHTGPVQCVATNPKYTMFASGCSNTALWLW
mmetsp:Transcript_14391/g.21107  ORF Transcript_14391/g.21107 Transcript_14391/m.21107 type:complete len:334 (-) Transcript_14391:653-1654(-)